MAIPRKGSRIITVDGVRYRWRVRQKMTYCQGAFGSNYNVSVERADPPSGSVLVLTTNLPHHSNWLVLPTHPVTPSIVASCIREAIEAGWHAEVSGPPFIHTHDLPNVSNLDSLDKPGTTDTPEVAAGSSGFDISALRLYLMNHDDTQLAEQLIGTWRTETGLSPTVESEVTYHPDGTATEIIRRLDRPESEPLRVETRWEITDRVMTMTCTKSSDRMMIPVGMILRDRITLESEDRITVEACSEYGVAEGERETRVRVVEK